MDEQTLHSIFDSLNRHRVEYAVFGAVALGLHGLPRATEDLFARVTVSMRRF